jgi:hypothetical protein
VEDWSAFSQGLSFGQLFGAEQAAVCGVKSRQLVGRYLDYVFEH